MCKTTYVGSDEFQGIDFIAKPWGCAWIILVSASFNDRYPPVELTRAREGPHTGAEAINRPFTHT